MDRKSFVWKSVFSIIASKGLVASAQNVGERHQTVKNGKTSIGVTIRGAGERIVFIPSLGRGVSDFDRLSNRLLQSGYRAVLPDPRGIGASSGPMEGITLHDLAADVAAVIRATGTGPVTVIGHAFGNRVARMLATDHPDLIKRVFLLAAGGHVEMAPEVLAAFNRVFELNRPRQERLQAIHYAFFAPGNDASVWEHGWYPAVAKAQRAAVTAVDAKVWWAGGTAPIVVLQAMDDVIAVPENSRNLAAEFPNRITIVEIAKSGHAMLPEQPELIAAAILSKLR